jgi:hypothetical protein
MFIIDEVLVEEPVIRSHFSCDLQQCKGACCTLPGAKGAPLEDEEVIEIESVLPYVKKFLTRRNIELIEREGFYVGFSTFYTTQCVEHNECVFVFYEDGIARCAIEKAYDEGLTKWRKPISCHLFPIRVSQESKPRLYYEEIPECKPGKRKGNAQQMPLSKFVKEALVRKFGEQWYEQLFLHE